MQHKGVVCAEWLPPLWLEAHAGMLTACKLGLAGSDASACTPSTSIASGGAAAGLAAHAFCAAGCAGALLKKPNMLCWPCLALLPACHSLLHFSACSSLLNLLLPIAPFYNPPLGISGRFHTSFSHKLQTRAIVFTQIANTCNPVRTPAI